MLSYLAVVLCHGAPGHQCRGDPKQPLLGPGRLQEAWGGSGGPNYCLVGCFSLYIRGKAPCPSIPTKILWPVGTWGLGRWLFLKPELVPVIHSSTVPPRPHRCQASQGARDPTLDLSSLNSLHRAVIFPVPFQRTGVRLLPGLPGPRPPTWPPSCSPSCAPAWSPAGAGPSCSLRWPPAASPLSWTRPRPPSPEIKASPRGPAS